MLDYKDRYSLLCDNVADELFNKDFYDLTYDEEKKVLAEVEKRMIDSEAQLIDEATDLTYEQEDFILEEGLEKCREKQGKK